MRRNTYSTLALVCSMCVLSESAFAYGAEDQQLSPEAEARIRAIVEKVVRDTLAKQQQTASAQAPVNNDTKEAIRGIVKEEVTQAKAQAATRDSSHTADIINEVTEKVKLYGVLDYGLTYVSNEGGSSKTGERDGVNWGNRLGLTGSQDLDWGLKAVFTIEHGFNLSDGTTSQYGTTWGRQAYAGLENKWGRLTFGRQYDFVYDYMNQLNIGGYATTYAGHHGDFDRISGWRVDRSIKFQSATFDGFKFGIMYATDDAAYPGQASGNKETLSLGASYFAGPWSLAAAYVRIDNNDIYPDLQIGVSELLGQKLTFDGSALIVNQETAIVGGHYQLGKFTLVGNTSQTTFKRDGEKDTQHVYEIGGYYPVAEKTTAIVGYQYSTLANDDWNQYTVGVKRDLSEKTWLYASYSWMKASDGVRANQGAGWYLDNSSDNRQDTARLGMVYTF
ncbi:MAG TPA: porin [Pseudomonas sp.]|uniref:porin n=1 Tax=Pseudomonas sp. TaxID=306 RepID=UPI002EDAADB0